MVDGRPALKECAEMLCDSQSISFFNRAFKSLLNVFNVLNVFLSKAQMGKLGSLQNIWLSWNIKFCAALTGQTVPSSTLKRSTQGVLDLTFGDVILISTLSKLILTFCCRSVEDSSNTCALGAKSSQTRIEAQNAEVAVNLNIACLIGDKGATSRLLIITLSRSRVMALRLGGALALNVFEMPWIRAFDISSENTVQS